MTRLEEFGKHIKELRELNGFKSQRSLADTLGVSNATIARIERGEVEASVETIKKMAEVFHMDYMDLVAKQDIVLKSGSELLNEKIQKLSKAQVEIVNSMVDEFLRLSKKI
ncbi:TPA: helix-turn-helix transcriptional regulator [Bacillus cereus]|uniref:helix-turn-helix domain-containing protein n=1 Tax=Bacillus paranthracis TaxID=2026186 RepID=UPI002D76F85C|nr:helix-turn-helix transcriptional regulator [Bacillus paranthracis]HDR8453977.1 helix-turn-helix transcriptional regulator [Bacillus cereus]